MNSHGVAATYSLGCRCNLCRQARSEYDRAYRKRHQKKKLPRHFDVAPLKRRVETLAESKGLAVRALLGHFDLDPRFLYGDRSTIGWVQLDRICCTLGFHPTELYPEFLGRAS